MWSFLGDLMPGPVWAWGGTVGLAVLGPWIGYRLGRRNERASEQRQVLRDLLTVLLDVRSIGEIPAFNLQPSRGSWEERLTVLMAQIRALRTRIEAAELRDRLRYIHIAELEHSVNVGENFYMPEGDTAVRTILVEDALEVVGAALRKEPIPALPEKGGATRVAEDFFKLRGYHPELKDDPRREEFHGWMKAQWDAIKEQERPSRAPAREGED